MLDDFSLIRPAAPRSLRLRTPRHAYAAAHFCSGCRAAAAAAARHELPHRHAEDFGYFHAATPIRIVDTMPPRALRFQMAGACWQGRYRYAWAIFGQYLRPPRARRSRGIIAKCRKHFTL